MQRPIIFICHSLGGIVCKKVHILIPVLAKPEPPVTGFQALILAQTKRYYANIYEKTTSIFFFVCLNSTSPIYIQSSLKSRGLLIAVLALPAGQLWCRTLSIRAHSIRLFANSFYRSYLWAQPSWPTYQHLSEPWLRGLSLNHSTRRPGCLPLKDL